MPDNEIDQEIIQQVANSEDVPAPEELETPSVDGGDSPSIEPETTEEAEATEPTIDGLEIPKPDIEEAPADDAEALKRERNAWAERRIREKELKLKRESEKRQLEKEQDAIVQLQAQTAVAQLAASAPNRDDFADENEFTEAVVSYTLAKRQVAAQVESQTRERLAYQQKFHDEIEETKSKGSAKYSDFDEVVEPLFTAAAGVPPNIPLVNALNESKFGSDILYMLGKNRAKAIEIAKLPALQAAKWVWETERKFEEARAKTKSGATGIKIMQKVSSKLTPTKDISQMNNKEYKAYWRKKQYG